METSTEAVAPVASAMGLSGLAKTVKECREFILNVLGNNECWVDCKGDIFTTAEEMTFCKKNFDFFYYDPVGMVMFVRPTMEMHKTTVDNYESLPNDYYTKMLLENGTGDVIIIYKDTPSDDETDVDSADKIDDYPWHVETMEECTLEQFLEKFPGSISLLP